VNCPYCGEKAYPANTVRGAATLIGTGAGGYVAASAGAQTGAIVGSLLFPGIGTILGILVGAAGGAVAGNTVGKLVDENVIRNWKCPVCGYTWRM